MKKIGITFLAVLILLLSATAFAGTGDRTEYVRIHVRANSDSEYDQSIKLKARDLIVDYLTPEFEGVSTKEEAKAIIEKDKTTLKRLIDELLIENGYDYKSNIRTCNEYFPTRKYESGTLEAGYYDAVIVELGKAEGANWWCVVYPPLCFSGQKVKYRSFIWEAISKLFE